MMRNEYRQSDSDGRIPLSYREYNALRTVFGAVNAFEQYSSQLERRARGVKNLWRDMQLLRWMASSVMERLLKTVPAKKLKQIRNELEETVCEVKVRGISGSKAKEYFYVEQQTLIDLCRFATELNCFGCQKSHEEAKRNCKLYKDIQSVFNYEFEECENCLFAEGI